MLVQSTQYALIKLKDKIGKNPRRLSVYGNTVDILKHGKYGLKEINCGGTCGSCSSDIFGTRLGVDVIYWGLESGNSEVLKITGKGYNYDKAMDAAIILDDSKVRTSVMVIPGLGGMSHFDQHVKDTVAVLNTCEPNWITFMGLQINENTPYSTWINKQEKSNQNRRLTPGEIVEQTAQIIERLKIETTIGIYGNDVHQKSCQNPLPIGSEDVHGRYDCQKLAKFIRDLKVQKRNLC